MAIFVITGNLLRALPEEEYGSILDPFVNSEKNFSIAIDSTSKIKDCYYSIVQNKECNYPARISTWIELLWKMNNYNGKSTIVEVSIEGVLDSEELLFEEVSWATNNLTGMIIPDYNGKEQFCHQIKENNLTYRDKSIHIFDMFSAKKFLNKETEIEVIQEANGNSRIKGPKININYN